MESRARRQHDPIVHGAMKETGDFVKDTALGFHDLKSSNVIKEETHELIRMLTDGGEDLSPDPTDPVRTDYSGSNEKTRDNEEVK